MSQKLLVRSRRNCRQADCMPLFDRFPTGETNRESGLYLCPKCGEIIPLSAGEKFPPCAKCGSTEWVLVALAGKAGMKYRTGTRSPESGLFICTKCLGQVIPIAKGNVLPPCASCRSGTDWQLIVSA